MRKQKIFLMMIILIFIFLLNINATYATDEMKIISDKSVVEAEEEVGLNIDIENKEVQAFTLEIYWDRAMLEYISGPKNSNNLGNRIIYTWINESGKEHEKINIETFKFKALQDGSANIAVTGEFYNLNGDEIQIDDANLEVKVGKNEEENIEGIEEAVYQENNNVSDDNTNLSILRLDQEGISPDFNKDIKEYYFIANNTINDLGITAIPENSGATVTVTGNKNLKIGENTIEIKVESKDKSKTSIYKIYVSKTDNIELANANLETLAIRQGTLEPEFDSNMTKYKVEIANEIDKIDLLAVPQKENATVKIIGNGEMKEGDNLVQIVVLAENGTTNKKYEVLVHRRNGEEEKKYEEEREYQAERLSTVLEEEKQKEINNDKRDENKSYMLLVVVLASIIVIVITVFIYRYKLKNKSAKKK